MKNGLEYFLSLGFSVTRIGESILVLGVEGASQVGKGIKDVGEGIRNLFK
jgi:hypothetical protein